MILPRYRISASDIAGAGQGLFLEQDVAAGQIVTASAAHTLPGPEHSARSSCGPRRRRIVARPCVGSIARIRTAAAESSGSQTKFMHQWMPYDR